jgi:ABC-type amino acid transport substrate-binding protein
MTYEKLFPAVVMPTLAIGVAMAVALLGAPASAQVLKTGVDATYAPHAMVKLGGGLQGFNIDLGNEMARRMGKKLEIEGTEFSGLIPGLNAGKYDFVLAVVTATPERAKTMLFSEAYLNTDFTFIEKKSAPGIKGLEQLKGKTIAVNKGSAYESWLRDNAAKYALKFDVYGNTADALQAVQAGRADAVLAGTTSAAWAAKQNPQVKTSYTIVTGLVMALAYRANDKAGRDAASMALKCMKKDGFVSKAAEKWFGFKPAPDDAAVAIAPGMGVPGLDGYDATPVTLKCS